MRLYFLVEGVTERKLYPAWLTYLTPELTKIDDPYDRHPDAYYLITAGGFPQLLEAPLRNSMRDIHAAGNYDLFVVALDAEEETVEEKIRRVETAVQKHDIPLGSCKTKILVQNRCIETWLLGNRKVYPRQPVSPSAVECVRFYNVSQDDPELMTKPDSCSESIAKYHLYYLTQILLERRISYTKRSPKDACKPHYVDQLMERVNDTSHLQTSACFFELCKAVNAAIEDYSGT